MAASTISHNTPAAGSITWTAFNIAYDGDSFPVPAGSTAGRFVWWEYRNGAPAVLTGDALPDLGPDDTVLFINKGGIGQLLPDTTIVDGSLIVEESILASAIGADQINGGHIQADAVDTEHLAAGSVTADQLSVGTVSANLVANGSFEDYDADGTIIGWEVSAMTNGTIQPVTGVASSGAVAIQFAPSTTSANLRLRQTSEKLIPVSAASGRRWYVSARMGVAGTSTTSGSYLRVNWYDANRAFLSSTDIRANGGLSTTFAVYEGQATPPAAARFLGVELLVVNPNITSNAYADEVTVHEVLVAAHIGDGQITTPKLVAGSVTADKILLSDWTNYWSNPDYEGETVNAQPRGIVANTACRVKDISAMNTGNGSSKALEIDAKSGSNNDVYDLNVFPVKPGEQFYVRFQGRHLNTTGTGITALGFRTYNAKKVGNTWTRVAEFGATKTTTWTEVEGVYTVPAGTYFLQPWAAFFNNSETTNRFYMDNVTIRRMAGGELIVDGAITAGKLETDLVLSTRIVAGDPDGTHAEMSPEGFRVFAADPGDGIPNEVVRLGVASSDDYFAVTRADGSLAATISQDGVLSASTLYADADLYYRGTELQAMLDRAPRGIQAYGVISQDIGFGVNEYGMFDVSFQADASRAYRVHVKTTCAASDGAGIKWRVRSAVGTTRPGVTSYLQKDHEQQSSGSQWLSESWSFVSYPSYQSSGTWTERYLLTAQKLFSGSGTFKYGEVVVEDIGPRIWASAGINNGGGSPTPTAQQYTKTYAANNSSSYTGSGGVYGFDTGRMYQGLSPAGYGNLSSIATFPDMTADLSGATISQIRAYFYFGHWYYNSGGTAKIGVHGHTSPPGTFSHSGGVVDSTGWPKPGGRWVDIPSQHWEGFKTGAYRGLSLVGDGTYGTYGYADRPTIEITYSK